MKHFFFVGFTIALLMMSCEPAATFSEPQPVGTTNESKFSNKIQGDYWSEESAELLQISDLFIISQYNEIEKIHKDSLEKHLQIKADTLFDLKTGSKDFIDIQSDTVFIYRNYTDTLFAISENEILKKWKGYYFLNSTYSDTAWEVKKLWLNKGTLTIGEVASLSDINSLQELTASVGDSSSKPFQLSNKQFKKFVREDGFREQKTYKRVTLSN
jgi:hypothetical protein